MSTFFDHERWSALIQQPNWYLVIDEEYQSLIQRAKAADEVEAEGIKHEVREFFERALLEGRIALGEAGSDMDAQRKPVDTIVIHHTSNAVPYTLPRMNAVHLLNLYLPYYTAEGEDHGKPVWSGHFDATGQQVFYGYHWLVRRDGTTERLLPDTAIGWQAGNWDINTRSIGICLDNDYEHEAPSDEVLRAVASLIRTQYGHIDASKIVGHNEVSKITTVCPGNGFKNDWKSRLIGFVKE